MKNTFKTNKYNIIPYIIEDKRKSKFINYSTSENFYSLDYKSMKKAIAIDSKYALLTKKKNKSISTFYDNNYIYYFKLLNDDLDFGIIEVIEIKDNINIIEEIEYERFKRNIP